MDSVPGLLRRIITEDMWQERIVPESGEVITFERFEDFVTTDPLDGLGTTMDVVKALCKKQEDVLALLRGLVPEEGKHGTNQHSGLSIASPSAKGGTTVEYTIARLKRDNPPLAEKVIQGTITAAEARRQAGWEKEKIAIRLDDPKSAAQTILKRMDREAIAELLAILAEAIAQRE
jgi:hypothetical protein